MRTSKILFYVGALLIASCSLLGPADRAQVVSIAAQIEACQEMGRACKADGGAHCLDIYDSCMKEAGLH